MVPNRKKAVKATSGALEFFAESFSCLNSTWQQFVWRISMYKGFRLKMAAILIFASEVIFRRLMSYFRFESKLSLSIEVAPVV